MSEVVEIVRGEGPIVLAMPHTGIAVPPDIMAALNDTGRALADTDWNVHRLYEGLLPDVTVARALTHRYVVDANRPPDGASLYPSQNTTGLCPTTDFDGAPIYRDGCEPDDAEIAARVEAFHAPYHAALRTEVDRVRTRHGIALLYDCHSIRSVIPFLFEGRLPDLNIGTNGGQSCGESFGEATVRRCTASGFGTVRDGRFKGGWATRHYGRPHEGVHAIQMEIAQIAYMDEAPPWTYREDKADALRPVLADVLSDLATLAEEHAR